MPIDLHATCDRRIAELEREKDKLRAALAWAYTACIEEIEQVPGLEDAIRTALKRAASRLDDAA